MPEDTYVRRNGLTYSTADPAGPPVAWEHNSDQDEQSAEEDRDDLRDEVIRLRGVLRGVLRREQANGEAGGWHRHGDVVMNDRLCAWLHGARDHRTEPVLVVPLGEARVLAGILDALDAQDDYVRTNTPEPPLAAPSPSEAS